jgi:hypothetical protein
VFVGHSAGATTTRDWHLSSNLPASNAEHSGQAATG